MPSAPAVYLYRSARRPDGDTLIFTVASTSCTNAVYYRGEDISEIEGLSLVNTWRTLFNRLLGSTFELVPMPNYYD